MDRIFWGLVLIVIGALLVLRNVFGINIPIFSTLIAIILIVWGLSILAKPRNRGKEGSAIFEEKEIKTSEEVKKYDAVFGRGAFDLRALKPKDTVMEVEVSAVFGSAVITVDPETPMRIKGTSAFGTVRMPNDNSAAFGDVWYTTKSYKEGEPHIFVKANAVFGSVEITEK